MCALRSVSCPSPALLCIMGLLSADFPWKEPTGSWRAGRRGKAGCFFSSLSASGGSSSRNSAFAGQVSYDSSFTQSPLLTLALPLEKVAVSCRCSPSPWHSSAFHSPSNQLAVFKSSSLKYFHSSSFLVRLILTPVMKQPQSWVPT